MSVLCIIGLTCWRRVPVEYSFCITARYRYRFRFLVLNLTWIFGHVVGLFAQEIEWQIPSYWSSCQRWVSNLLWIIRHSQTLNKFSSFAVSFFFSFLFLSFAFSFLSFIFRLLFFYISSSSSSSFIYLPIALMQVRSGGLMWVECNYLRTESIDISLMWPVSICKSDVTRYADACGAGVIDCHVLILLSVVHSVISYVIERTQLSGIMWTCYEPVKLWNRHS